MIELAEVWTLCFLRRDKNRRCRMDARRFLFALGGMLRAEGLVPLGEGAASRDFQPRFWHLCAKYRNLTALRASSVICGVGAAMPLFVEGKEAPWPCAPSRWGNVSDGVQRDELLVDAAQSTR